MGLSRISDVLRPEEIPNPKPERSGDTTPCRMTGVALHRFGVDDETYMMSMLSKGVSEISTAETGSKSGQEQSRAPKPVFKAHRLVYHSTLGLRVIKKKKKKSEIVYGKA